MIDGGVCGSGCASAVDAEAIAAVAALLASNTRREISISGGISSVLQGESSIIRLTQL
ncbi:MAG TPA: hypothetical protein VN158_09725 [Caulobacter sp.]|nr:hypothetical protein [Caulobacter sp.]